VALVPTVLVAVFAVLTLNIGLEGWFSQRVRDVVGSSLAAATAYDADQTSALRQDASAFAASLNGARRDKRLQADTQVRDALGQLLPQVQRGLSEVYFIDGAGTIRARGPRSYLFGYEQLSPSDFSAANAGEIVIVQDWPQNEMRALIRSLAGRIYSYHVKDMRADRSMTSVGSGTVDFAAIFKLNAIAGVQHFYVENDQAPAPYIPDITKSFQTLRALRF
jgi:nitrogen fixation/metabolism regulation signal transduction histidine kinase